jgi:hypothetical protein
MEAIAIAIANDQRPKTDSQAIWKLVQMDAIH